MRCLTGPCSPADICALRSAAWLASLGDVHTHRHEASCVYGVHVQVVMCLTLPQTRGLLDIMLGTLQQQAEALNLAHWSLGFEPACVYGVCMQVVMCLALPQTRGLSYCWTSCWARYSSRQRPPTWRICCLALTSARPQRSGTTKSYSHSTIIAAFQSC
jgi:hypothetical protein